MDEITPFLQQVAQHRGLLQKLQIKMQSDYDKAVMTLSGGALAVSLSFLKDVALKSATHFTWCLLAAWVCWGFSATSVAFSFFSSSLALGKAVEQTDDKLLYYDGEEHGGKCNRLTKLLNPLAGALFFFGVLFIVAFVALNLP